MTAGANRHDMKWLEPTLQGTEVPRPAPTPAHSQGLCLDKGYDYDEVRDLAAEFGYTAHVQSRGEEAQALRDDARFKARRWVVERAHSWLNRFRPLLVRWEKRADTYLAMLHLALDLALGVITWRKCLLGSKQSGRPWLPGSGSVRRAATAG